MKRMVNLPGPAQQLDLFGDDRPRTIVDTPAWPELPAETRATLTGLMARDPGACRREPGRIDEGGRS
jgi:hypothetical protein